MIPKKKKEAKGKDDRRMSKEPEAGPNAYSSGKPGIPLAIHLFIQSFIHSFYKYVSHYSMFWDTMKNITKPLVLEALTYQWRKLTSNSLISAVHKVKWSW